MPAQQQTYIEAYNEWKAAVQRKAVQSAVWPCDTASEMPTVPMSEDAMLGRALATGLDAAINEARRAASPQLPALLLLRDAQPSSLPPETGDNADVEYKQLTIVLEEIAGHWGEAIRSIEPLLEAAHTGHHTAPMARSVGATPQSLNLTGVVANVHDAAQPLHEALDRLTALITILRSR